MTAHKIVQPIESAQSSNNHATSCLSEHTCSYHIDIVCSEHSIWPLSLNEHDRAFIHSIELCAGAASRSLKCSVKHSRRGSRDLSSSLGDRWFQSMNEVLVPQHYDDLCTEQSDTETCPTVSSMSRSSTCTSTSDSLSDPESGCTSAESFRSKEINSQQDRATGTNNSAGCGNPGRVSTLEATSLDLDEFFDFDKYDSAVDACEASSAWRHSDTASSSFEPPQSIAPRISSPPIKSHSTSSSIEDFPNNVLLECSECGRCFKGKRPSNSLQRHRRKKHQKAQPQIIRCKVCDYPFTQRWNLDRHFKKFHTGE